MPRHALRTFFERVVIATLPLVVPACSGNDAHTRDHGTAPTDMSAAAQPGDDMTSFNPTVPPKDPCESAHPPMVMAVTPAQLVDGGTVPECRAGGECLSICANGYTLCCGPYPADGGALTVTCNYDCGPTGRRPVGLAAAATRGSCGVGHYLAAMAHLEAASVHAFRTLARQLGRLGAPARLVARAVAAARDEVRHTRLARALARRHGATPPPVALTSAPPLVPSLETLAADNAVEGCVRETFGALLAAWQARTAGDAEIRAAMTRIADDEAAHAELAWDLDAWLMPRVDAPARARVRAARAQAIAALEHELAAPPPSLLIDRAGLPDVARAQQLFRHARAHLWS
jgi:hypothetical protein